MSDAERNSDRELVDRFRQGDRDAFTALYRTHHAAVFRFAFYMTADRTRAVEVTQDVFVWLLNHAREFEPARGSLPAFLGGVARKFLRRQQRSARKWVSLDERTVALVADPNREDISIGMAREQDVAELNKAIAALPERYREAVVLCDLERKSYEEAAVIVGCAIGTVRSRLHRARELLVRKLQRKNEYQSAAGSDRGGGLDTSMKRRPVHEFLRRCSV